MTGRRGRAYMFFKDGVYNGPHLIYMLAKGTWDVLLRPSKAPPASSGGLSIAVDASPLIGPYPKSGIPNYISRILTEMVRLDRNSLFTLYSPAECDFPEEDNLEKLSLFKKKIVLGRTWLYTFGVLQMMKRRTDVLWATRQDIPPVLPKTTKRIINVYDLVWYYFPETMEERNLRYMRRFAERSFKMADHIVTISQATSKSLMEVLGVPEEKITIVYPAADGYTPLDKEESAEYISQKYGTNKNYLLTVSTVEPRKNLNLLLRVFGGLREKGLQLVVAGASGWKTSSIHEEYEKLGLSEREIQFLGYVPDEDMNRLYSGARLFVFPSLYEGFGIPPLEAMASGTAVVASNSSSLPEVVGDAGMLLDPHDDDAWTKAMGALLGDEALRKEMEQKGLERARLFSWRKSAEELFAVFRKCI